MTQILAVRKLPGDLVEFKWKLVATNAEDEWLTNVDENIELDTYVKVRMEIMKNYLDRKVET